MPITPEARHRLAELMESRRLELDLRWQDVAAAGGLSLKTLHSARTGTAGLSPLTKRGIEKGLRWAFGSVSRVLDTGSAPVPLEAGEPAITQAPSDSLEAEIRRMNWPRDRQEAELAGWRQAMAPRPGDPPLDDEEVAALSGFWRQWLKPEEVRMREIAAIRDHLAAQKRGDLPAQRELRRNGTDDRPDPAA